MSEIVELFAQYGMSTAIIIYFLFKDYKFNGQIVDVLTEIKEVLTVLKAVNKIE